MLLAAPDTRRPPAVVATEGVLDRTGPEPPMLTGLLTGRDATPCP
jgi:hypothetical protein